jgi:hypothetical protein
LLLPLLLLQHLPALQTEQHAGHTQLLCEQQLPSGASAMQLLIHMQARCFCMVQFSARLHHARKCPTYCARA